VFCVDVQRRSDGVDHIPRTIDAWSLLMRQLRTTLFLAARSGSKVHGIVICNNSAAGGGAASVGSGFTSSNATTGAVGAGPGNRNLSSSSKAAASPFCAAPLSVDALDSGMISIYSILAADTLCFASKADHALEHEQRCLQVYARRSNTAGVTAVAGASTLSDSSDSSRAILAWGATADKRWRELIQVTEAEDQAAPEDADPLGSGARRQGGAGEAEAKKIRRRRPLLLFFPHHNNSAALGINRVLNLVEK
jgi:hypothetical protein